MNPLPGLLAPAGLWLAFTTALCAEPMRVGVFEKPPYAFRDADGAWRGLAVELWERVAARAGLDWEWVGVDFETALGMLESGGLDAIVSEVVPTAELARRVDFAPPWLASSLGLAVPEERGLRGLVLLETFFSWEFAKPALGLLAFLLLSSLLVWLAERKHHTGHFAGKPLEGLGSAIWFAATTITTVGYGDKTPQTAAGRAIVIALMFCGLLIIAGFTGAVASIATSARLQAETREFGDLAGRRVGVLKGGPARALLQNRGIFPVEFATLEEALEAMETKKVAAVAADRNLLAWQKQHGDRTGFLVPPARTGEFFLAMALGGHAAHRRALNVATLEVLESAEWNGRLAYWLGAGEAGERARPAPARP